MSEAVSSTEHHDLQRGIDEGWIRPAPATGRIGAGPRCVATQLSLDALTEDRND